MKPLPILTFGAPELRTVAKPVTVFHRKLRAEIDAIAATLDSRNDGAALAAPQVGILKRIVVIDYQGEYLELVNPVISARSGADLGEEGCLSLSGYFGQVSRALTVTVRYQNRQGEDCTIERTGPLARCLQHEIDHLDGILFVDHMAEPFLTHYPSGRTVPLSTVLEKAGPPPSPASLQGK